MANYLLNLLTAKLKNLHSPKDVQDEWRTPELEFLGIERKFCKGGFSIDLFTDGKINSKSNLFFTAKDNALVQDWGKFCEENNVPKKGYANPPFSKPHKGLLDDGSTCTGIKSFMDKAYAEMIMGFYSVWFVPNNPEADWFPDQDASEIYWVTGGRISFDVPSWYKQNPELKPPSSSRGGMCIIIFNPNHIGQTRLNFISREDLRAIGQQVLDERKDAA